MPKTVDSLDFDSKLFGLQVGRIVLDDGDLASIDKAPDLAEIVRHAYSGGYNLLYLFAPPRLANSTTEAPTKFLGQIVDHKTTYELQLKSMDPSILCKRAYTNEKFRIKRYEADPSTEASDRLKELAVASGAYSRFNIDECIPRSGYHGMFHGWLRNSLNHSVADEVFIAQDLSSGEEIGFITVKCKGSNVNIGLLAVHESCRRGGVASALLSRAALWAWEQIGYLPHATMNVVTQGSNAAACACYERFGFSVQSRQDVYHIWLPRDLPGPISKADRDPIPFCRQHFTGKEIENCAHLLTHGLDSAGHYNASCSSLIQQQLGEASSRVLVVPSGTAALEMAALLCDLQAGDEVIMPSYTFASTANAFVLRGAVPVFVDVHVDTMNINEQLIEAAITPKTKAICVVHYAGVPCEMDSICAIAQKHGLRVIEDAAQGYLSKYKGRPIGSIGDFGCFSFHYTKNVICGEGGAISINQSTELARRALVMWEKGTNRYDFMMGRIDKYEWIDVGSSFVPSELSCAVLLTQLQAAKEITAKRLSHYDEYRKRLSSLASMGRFFDLCAVPSHCEVNGHICFLLFKTASLRERFQEGLKQRGIAAFTHYVPLHTAPAGRRFGRCGGDLPVTERAHHCLLRLPMWTDLQAHQVDLVIAAIENIASSLDTL